MNKLTLFLLLDAFRWDYISETNTPTLFKLSQSSIYAKKLRSSSGFTQRSSIFTGTWPEESGNFTMFTYNPEGSQYRYLKYFPFLSLFEFRWPLADMGCRFILQKINKYFFKARFFPPAFIPFQLLPLIGISEDEIPIFQPGAFGKLESIFDVFARHQTPVEFLMHPLSNGADQWVYSSLLNTKMQSGIIFAQFSDSDGLIHKLGVGSQGALDVIRDIDNRVEHILKTYQARYDDLELIIIGDHGMVNVEQYLDVNKFVIASLKKQGLRFGKDYFTFLSSTLCHFWHFSDKAKNAIELLLSEPFFSSNGFVLTEEICKQFKIPFIDRQYGDVTWAANSGVLIFPDYFHRYKKYKAMHGYISDVDGLKGFAMVYNAKQPKSQVMEQADLIDLCPTITQSLGLEEVRGHKGVGLLQR